MRKLFHIMTALTLTAATGALAGTNVTCTTEPPSNWIGEVDMNGRSAAMGYAFDVFITMRGGIHEPRGRNSNGKRVEAYFNPGTGGVVNVFE